MSVTLGIAVGADRIRAVALNGGRIVAANETTMAEGGVQAAVAELLAGAPLPRFPRPRVVVALGPSRSQTRRIGGLPPLDDARMLAEIVREGVSRFFLRNGVPLATTGVRMVEPGVVWAAALDERVLREVDAACRAAGLRVDRYVPSLAVLGHALTDGEVVWADGGWTVEARYAVTELASVRRLPEGTAIVPPPVVPALARLGEDAWQYADAYGAAALPAWEPLALRPAGGGPGTVPRWRVAVAAAAALAALTFTALAPALRAMRAEDEAAARIAKVQSRHRAAAETERELVRVTAGLREAAAFGAGSYSPLLLLSDLTAALPAGSALITLRVDTAGGSLVALSPRAEAVVQPLEKVPGLVSPEIVGPVTRESLLGRELERVTIRFAIEPGRRGPSPVAASAPAEADSAGGAP
ncbi:hypothetical protein [Longimicrobium terrae]|uniref:PilN domain-containing protein n=1 Tax=Longimicrobium terrae TaxID=1639882 RepID=A0A841H2S7_9BACT|nr:hypothetical protein [Longimicrobium terrae]MBB4638029.1 hypothetical protein [Longimicrobium terrae]MBB6072401.1 hypothetical protein [Longimicrobium terrae]NNC32185.1 hypothetical protein [Longimicrobium terrae]